MKRAVLFATAFMALATAGWCEESAKKPVALVAMGDVDDAVVKDAQAWAESNLALPVPLLEKLPAGKGLLDAQGREAAKVLHEGDLGLVVMVWPEDDIPEQGVVLPEDRVVVVNMRSIKANAADETQYHWRAERLVMRGIALIAGLDSCPDPHCVFGFYDSRIELDSLGRNFCPPCLQKVQLKYRDAGIEANAENPFNILQGTQP